MKRFISALVIITMTLAVWAVSVSANPSYDSLWRLTDNGDTLTVTGKWGLFSNIPYTAVMYEADGAKRSLEDSVSICQGLTQRIGTFCFTVGKANLSEGMSYVIRMQAAGAEGSVLVPYYYATAEELSSALAAVNAAMTAADMQGALDAYSRVLCLNLTDYNRLQSAEKAVVCSRLAGGEYTSAAAFSDAFYRALNPALHLYVSASEGSAVGDGSQENPFDTVSSAKSHIQKLILNGDIQSDVTVHIGAGVYREPDGLTFTEYDVLPNGNKLTFAGEPGAVISGSVEVTGWEQYRDNIYMANVGKGKTIDILYENAAMLTKARYPNKAGTVGEDYCETLGVSVGGAGSSIEYSTTQFEFAAADIPQISNPADLEASVWAGGGIMWFEDILDVKALDYTNHTVTLAGNARYQLAPKSKYFLQGALELLDEPGEFYYDTNAGMLYYIPTDLNIAGKTVTIPSAPQVIAFHGSSPEKPVENIELTGLTVENTTRSVWLSGSGYTGETGSGIVLTNAQSITLYANRIHDVGGHGILLHDSVNRCRVYGNEIYHTGQTGVMVAGEGAALICTENEIVNNNIHDGSLISGDGMGISNNHSGSGSNLTAHNKIHGFRRFGIQAANHRFTNFYCYNEISEVNTGSEDAGMIYAGPNPNATDGSAVFFGNYLHDSNWAHGGGAAIYFDTASHNAVAENNLIANVGLDTSGGSPWAAFYLKSDNDIVRNNYTVNMPNTNVAAIASRAQLSTADNQIVEHNVFYEYGGGTDHNVYRFYNWDERRVAGIDHNVFYHSAQTYNVGKEDRKLSWEQWKTLDSNKYDQDSLTVDPMFVNAAAGDYRLRADSPAFGLGITDLDLQGMGLLADFPFADPADTIDHVYVRKNKDTVNPAGYQMAKGEGMQLETAVRTQNGYIADDVKIRYSSSDAAVAAVTQSGTLIGISEGTAVITVAAEKNGVVKDTSLTITVSGTVSQVGSEAIQVNGSVFTDEGGTPAVNLSDDSLQFHAYLTGNQRSSVTVLPIMALFDVQGNITTVCAAEKMTIPFGEVREVALSVPLVKEAENDLVRVFLWENDTVRPLAETLEFPRQLK